MPHAHHDFVPFRKFTRDVETARLDDYLEVLKQRLEGLLTRRARSLTPGTLRNHAAREFAKMRDYVHRHYKGVHAVHSFLDASGNHIDCVPVGQHPAVQAAKAAGHPVKLRHGPAKVTKWLDLDPRGRGPKPNVIRSVYQPGKKDEYGHERVCPAGCVPMRRLTLGRLIRHGTLENFLHKGPPAPRALPEAVPAALPAAVPSSGPGPDGYLHRHALAMTEEGDFVGAAGGFNVWPPDYTPGEMSLSQLWIRRNIPGNPYPQTVESGWVNRLGGQGPALFVYVNPDGYGTQAGYERGFIPNDESTLHPEVALPFVSEADPDKQYSVIIQWELHENGDWVFYSAGENPGDPLQEVGHIPGNLYQNVSGSWTRVDFGGEVSNDGHSGVRTGQMGSGAFPTDPISDGFGSVAYQRSLKVLLRDADQFEPAQLSADRTFESDPELYKVGVGTSDATGGGVYFGGPGNPNG